jgi:hypothetical protein
MVQFSNPWNQAGMLPYIFLPPEFDTFEKECKKTLTET